MIRSGITLTHFVAYEFQKNTHLTVRDNYILILAYKDSGFVRNARGTVHFQSVVTSHKKSQRCCSKGS
jgi:hypothetical protein